MSVSRRLRVRGLLAVGLMAGLSACSDSTVSRQPQARPSNRTPARLENRARPQNRVPGQDDAAESPSRSPQRFRKKLTARYA